MSEHHATEPHPRPPLTDPDPHVKPAAYVTADVPAIGGVLKQRDEDFFVEEIPLVEPSGSGEYLHLFVEKQGLSTLDLVDVIARHFRVQRDAVSFAGLKDKRAITRQVVSVHAPGKSPEDFPMLDRRNVKILWADLHDEPIKRGQLVANRFSIRARELSPTAIVHAQRALTTLERVGVPNRFGVQRFGYLRNNHLIGRALVLGLHQEACDEMLGSHERSPRTQTDARMLYDEGDFGGAYDLFPPNFRGERTVLRMLASRKTPAQALAKLDRSIRSFYISSLQSCVFNAVLDRRLERGALGKLDPGDLAFVHEDRSHRPVNEQDLAEDGPGSVRARFDAFELSPSGPMWGSLMPVADAASGEDERAALAAFGMEPGDFARADQRLGEMLEGARRPLRVRVKDPEVEAGVDDRGAYIRCAFELPRGAFATTVMDEVLKGDAARGHV